MDFRVTPVTRPPGHHFFGYYDMEPWDPSGRYHLVLQVEFMDRPPTAEDEATVALVDLGDGCRLLPLARTRAWNFQQGSMLHWLDERTVLFNDRRDDRLVCVAQPLAGGRQRIIGPAVGAVTDDRRLAATLNFARIADTRPGYGYAGPPDAFADEDAPAGDGLGILDVPTGEHRLVLSFADVHRMVRSGGIDYGPGKIFFNHVLFNPSGTLLSVIVRWLQADSSWKTQLWTVRSDGGGALCCLDGPLVSHYDWKDDEGIIAWAGVDGREAMWEFDAFRRTRPTMVFGDVIKQDGHIGYSHDRRRVVCDTYPDARGRRELFLVERATGGKTSLGWYHSPMPPQVEIRCDLHPSFSRDDRRIAFDGMHEGTRQRYVLELLP